MKKFAAAAALLYFAGFCPAALAGEPQPLLQRYLERGQRAFDNQSFRSACSYWQKALKTAETDTSDKPGIIARIRTKLAEALAAQGNYLDADEHMHQALQLYTSLGGITPDFSRVFEKISKTFRLVPPDLFGQGGARTLNDNSAKVSVRKLDTGTRVEIDAPARFVADSGNDQIDQVGFDRIVTFDLKKDSDGTTVMENIKGFRVHVAEKNMWVNLLNLVVKGPDAESERDAEITAGKAGITKTVQHKLPSNVVAPLNILLQQASDLDTPVALSLPALPEQEAEPEQK